MNLALHVQRWDGRLHGVKDIRHITGSSANGQICSWRIKALNLSIQFVYTHTVLGSNVYLILHTLN